MINKKKRQGDVMLFEEPMKVSFVGRHADSHMLDAAKLSPALWGLSRLVNTSIYFWDSGLVPTSRQKAKYHVLVSAPQRGSLEILLNPETWAGLLPFLPEILSAVGQEVISQQLSAIFYKNSGREDDFEKAVEILFKLHQQYTQSMALERQQFYDFQLKLAEINRNSCIKAVSSLGFDANEMHFGNGRHDTTLDVYDAEVIRQKGLARTGDRAEYRVRVDGLIRHNRSLRLIVDGEEEKFISARVVDPVFDETENIYLTALSTKEWILIQAKPIFKDNELVQLVVLDAKEAEE